MYDQSGTSTYCDAMSTEVTVASTKEPYLYASSGACAGIVTDLYVPPAQKVSSSFAPMQMPYVVQEYIEAKLAATFKLLPVWVSNDCHFALRKYFCGSAYLHPEIQSLEKTFVSNGLNVAVMTALLKTYFSVNTTGALPYEFYLPSYPNNVSVCEEYSTACASFISVAGVAALAPTCQKVVNGTRSFPSTLQTVNTLAISLSTTSTITLKFMTSPNNMSTASDNGYETNCPAGFVVPDDPTNTRTVFVTGSGCAIGCR
jgi:hypothetical protein